ncbi:LacI family DNA-binding transcriptional regulator [Paractinoplanes toevensis]|uniref:DNA-binding protein n=1 Tax=Paractinoplanes toevensis TaxID=571911 RepID=A0A919W9H6_9ACTN|nr:LacI family DNA-binding transcriptional regulator [Actinoplanes toevensis]GIM96050.1 DNA-binding protein [Actinoplanes toevensis]
MKHPYRIREIAARAGLSEATVDRVLHQRGGVRESTAREVHQAIAALDREIPQSPAVPIDVIVPESMAAAVRQALETELPVVVRPRFHPVADAVEVLNRGRSQGVILTAPDTPEIIEAIGRAGVPVVTLGTDLPASKRVAFAGIDQADAGATAAYLVGQWLADRAGDVLVVRGTGADGEDERVAGFRAAMTARKLIEAAAVDQVLAGNSAIRAVYAPAGDTAGVVDAFAEQHRVYDVFVAHGLDAANAALLRAHKLSAVLHHDLRADVRQAGLTILRSQGVLPGPIHTQPAAVQVITPYNASL